MKWQVEINSPSLGGLAPGYFRGSYPSYGNKNQWANMLADCTTAHYIKAAQGLVTMVNGTDDDVVDTLIRGVLNFPTSSGSTFGCGGNKLYQMSYPSTIVDGGGWPHTIDKSAVSAEDAEDVAIYQGNLYYTYNHSGTLGDIGKYDLASTFDDDWGSTIPSGMSTLTGDVPHQMVVGNNDRLYIANGRYVASYDGTTLIPQALDLPQGSIIVSMVWQSDRLFILANSLFAVSNTYKSVSSVYVWDGTTDSWELVIPIKGNGSALYSRNGTVFVWYDNIGALGNVGEYTFGYISGAGVVDLVSFGKSGATLPRYYQVSQYRDFIVWNSDGAIHGWGSGGTDLPVRHFILADSGYSSVGCVASPYGQIFVASTNDADYQIAYFGGVSDQSFANSLIYDITGFGRNSRIDCVRINFEQLAAEHILTWRLVNNQGVTIYEDTISYAKATATVPKHSLTSAYYPLNGKIAENFRVELDWSGGDCLVKNIKVNGRAD